MGDFICDTSFDCYNFCEYALGCDASYLYQDHHPGQEQSEYEECELDYSPPLDNLMSRYGGGGHLRSGTCQLSGDMVNKQIQEISSFLNLER